MVMKMKKGEKMSDLIRREDAIKKIVGLNMQFYEGDTFVGIRAYLTKEEIIYAIDELPSVEPELKWIPVTEALPKDGERVLITHRGGVSFGWYNGSYWERGAPTNHRPLETVIAWMSLPESYKGE